MKRTVVYFLLALLGSVSCQKKASNWKFSTLELEFPWALTSQPDLFDGFLERAVKIEFRLYQKGREVWLAESRFEGLDKMVIPTEALEQESAILEVAFWDCLENGEPRDRPALGATVFLSKGEGGQVLRIPLTLKIPMEEWGY